MDLQQLQKRIAKDYKIFKKAEKKWIAQDKRQRALFLKNFYGKK